jgi:hypothetical protein
VIAGLGKKAKVAVKKEKGKPVYASAHDMRRSFGERWALRVPAAELQLLMRHFAR